MKNTPSPKANGYVGAPKEWYSRGYLPHRDAKQLLQAVTFRLADSLPQEKLTLLEDELSNLPKNKRSTLRREKIEQWLNAGIGAAPCATRNWRSKCTTPSCTLTASVINSSLGASCRTMCMCSWKLSRP